MSKIDYQKLREIAEKTKIAGEAPVMPFDQRINALNDFMKHFSPDIALALLDERERNLQYIKSRDQENEDIALTVGKLRVELEAKDSSISTQQHEIRTLLNALEQATEKRNSDIPGQKRLIGWRASDYTDETSDPELAKNWAAAIGVLPIFEGDVNTKLSAAGIKGE